MYAILGTHVADIALTFVIPMTKYVDLRSDYATAYNSLKTPITRCSFSDTYLVLQGNPL